MTESNRVFVTGYSALSSTGHTADETWQALLAGQTGIAEITQHDLSTWGCRRGGELKDFQPAKMLPDRKLVKVISRQDVMGINAAVQAVEHSGLIGYRDSLSDPVEFNEETAVYVGSPGNKYMQQYDFLPLVAKTGNDLQAFADQLFNEVHPMWLLRILPNNVLAYAGITYGFKGPNHNVTNHAVGGMQALIEAYEAIKNGQTQRAVVVAYDMGLEAQALYYYEKLGVLSPDELRPFDKHHNGTLLAEGAAALVLESEASAKSRNASCFAEIGGGFAASEASGLFALQPQGQPLSEVMETTLAKAKLEKEGLGLIIAHGNGNKASDVSEALAIKRTFGSHHLPVTALKWSMGHTLCASGLMDTVMAVYCMQNKKIPGIATLNEVSSECEGLMVESSPREWQTNHNVMIINRGFAGMDACLVMKDCD